MGVPYCLRPILENADFPCRKKPGGLDGTFTAKPGTFTGFSGLCAAKTAANPGWLGSFFCGSRMKREPSYADVSAAVADAADGKSRCSGLRGFPVFLQQPFGSLAQPRIYCDEKNIKNGLFLYRGYAGGMLYRFPLHLFCFKVIKQGAHFIC